MPELGLVAGTRVMAGLGLGLLLAGKLSEEQRRAAGWALFFAGALTTVPLAIEIFGKREHLSRLRHRRARWEAEHEQPATQDERSRG